MGVYRTLLVTGIIAETADCKTFLLTPADHTHFSYQPGQFLTFVFAKANGEDRRSYSISSTPFLQEQLSITVKRLENGEYSRKLFDHAQTGDALVTAGAAGFFVLPGNMEGYREVFFMAAGNGITPVFPLIKTLLYQHASIRVILIYSNRSRASTIFYEALNRLLLAFEGRFTIVFLFSSAQDLERARLSKWLLERLLITHSRAPYSAGLFYTCGPFDYMRMVSITLLENHVPLQQIRKENFIPLKMEHTVQPPDRQRHQVIIQWQGKTIQLDTQYPETILQAAKKAGLQLPYSCESGRCGSCAATCLQGRVWMSYNEVLMDDEIEKGRILTCTGYPIFGNIILRFS